MTDSLSSNSLVDFLRRWMGDGRLQTFEDRERFRREAGEMLARAPDETTDEDALRPGDTECCCMQCGTWHTIDRPSVKANDE